MTSSPIPRRTSTPVRIGGVTVGGTHPIVVQSMTNTDTADIEGTALPGPFACARRLGTGACHGEHRRGGRGGAAHRREARATRRAVPIVGDFHFNGHKLLRENPACAEALAKYRINPATSAAAASAIRSSRK
jgi:(E)-4-hydroxy-3-methylbut-2-enyl-diphosphate synthase